MLSPQGGEDKDDDNELDPYYSEVSPPQVAAPIRKNNERSARMKSIIISPNVEREELPPKAREHQEQLIPGGNSARFSKQSKKNPKPCKDNYEARETALISEELVSRKGS